MRSDGRGGFGSADPRLGETLLAGLALTAGDYAEAQALDARAAAIRERLDESGTP